MLPKEFKESSEFKALEEAVKKHLTLDNPYVKDYEPERDTYDEEKDDDGRIICRPYYLSDKEATQQAIESLFDDKDMLEEFITGYLRNEYLALMKVMLWEIYMEMQK